MSHDPQEFSLPDLKAHILHRAALEGGTHAVGVGQMFDLQDWFQRLSSLPVCLLQSRRNGVGTFFDAQSVQRNLHAMMAQPVQQIHRIRYRQPQ